jgi:hypothetical protein
MVKEAHPHGKRRKKMEAPILRVGTTELINAFLEQQLAHLVGNSQGATLEFQPMGGHDEPKDEGRGVKQIMVVAKSYWESLVACLHARSQPFSQEPKVSADNRWLAVECGTSQAPVIVKFNYHRPSNEVETIRLYYPGAHINHDLYRDPAFA